MVDVDKAQIAKIKKNGQNFEILIDSNLAIAFKSNPNNDIKEILAAEKIFADAKKGMDSSPIALKQAFGTDDPLEVAKEIILKGDVPLTAEYKQELRDVKRKQIINMIHRNAVDPKTHIPHPPGRIEAAMDEAKVHIDDELMVFVVTVSMLFFLFLLVCHRNIFARAKMSYADS